ncbi:MAG TPA: CD225/dispanin family protein, partial [Hymenobacter sp.]
CLPFGIVGIVNAASVNTKFAQGDFAGAQASSANAGKWTKIGFFSGLAIGVIYMVLMFLGVGGALMSGMANHQ